MKDFIVEKGNRSKLCMVCVHIFSKKLQVVPVKTNDPDMVYDVIMERFKTLKLTSDSL